MNDFLRKTVLLVIFSSVAIGRVDCAVAETKSPSLASKVSKAVKKTVATAVGLPLLFAAPINAVIREMCAGANKDMFAKVYHDVRRVVEDLNKIEGRPFRSVLPQNLVPLNALNREYIRKQWIANLTLGLFATVPASIVGAIILYKTWLAKSADQMPSRKKKEDLQATALGRLMQLVQQIETDRVTAQELKTVVEDSKQLLESIAHSAERAEFAAQQVEALVKQIESSDLVQAKSNYHAVKAYKDARKKQAEAEAAVAAVGGLSLCIALALVALSQ